MGCCSSVTPDMIGTMGSEYQIPRGQRFQCTEYCGEELIGDVDIEIVCITKPELSYIVKVAVDQLHLLTLRDLETQVIKDMSDHMIESFRLLHSAHIEKPYYHQKLVKMLDLLPIYVELSVDETMDSIQIEIPFMKHVINLPYDSKTSIKIYKKKIALQITTLQPKDFELLFKGEVLRFDDMSLSEYSILPGSKLIVLDQLAASNHARNVFFDQKEDLALFAEIPQTKYLNELRVSSSDVLQLLQNSSMSNITRIITEENEENNTVQEDQFDIQSNLQGKSRLDTTVQYLQDNYQKQRVETIGDIVINNSSTIVQNLAKEQQLASGGFEIIAECLTFKCHMFKVKQYFNLGFGEFFLNSEDQFRIATCKACNGQTIPLDFIFRSCSFAVSGIYKQREELDTINRRLQDRTPSSKLMKQNDGLWIHENSERSYNFRTNEIEWKQIRARVTELKQQSLPKCCLCTQKIYSNKEVVMKLDKCGHLYHAVCQEKLQKFKLPCVMCIF